MFLKPMIFKTGRRLLSFLALFLFSGILSLFAERYKSGGNHPFVDPTPGEIAIMASTPIPHGLKSTKKDYEDLIECGFNLGNEGYSPEQYEREFEIIGDLNFKYLIQSKFFLTEKMPEIVDRFKNNPYVVGWNFKDEPNYADLNSLKSYYDILYNYDPSKLIFINLIGGLNPTATGPAKSYLDYLNIIQKYFKPGVWSFDLYPVFFRNGKIDVAYDVFFEDLEAMYAISKKTDRPFWSYCQSMAFKTKSFERLPATVAFLRFANFSALAYGTQGILYWTYGQRYSNGSENYLSALVNLNGEKTPAWFAAKQVNGEIKKFNDIFYQCVVNEVRHTGAVRYKGTKKLSGSFGPFKKIVSGDAGVLLSRIENNGKHYIVVVNHDLLRPQKVSFLPASGREIVNLTDTSASYKTGEAFSVYLSEGGYAIFREI